MAKTLADYEVIRASLRKAYSGGEMDAAEFDEELGILREEENMHIAVHFNGLMSRSFGNHLKDGMGNPDAHAARVRALHKRVDVRAGKFGPKAQSDS